MGLKRKKTPDGDPDPNPDPEPDNSLQEARSLQLSALKNMASAMSLKVQCPSSK